MRVTNCTLVGVYCVNHPDHETLLSCAYCEDPICVECLHNTQVGGRCPRCAGKETKPDENDDKLVKPAAANEQTIVEQLNEDERKQLAYSFITTAVVGIFFMPFVAVGGPFTLLFYTLKNKLDTAPIFLAGALYHFGALYLLADSVKDIDWNETVSLPSSTITLAWIIALFSWLFVWKTGKAVAAELVIKRKLLMAGVALGITLTMFTFTLTTAIYFYLNR